MIASYFEMLYQKQFVWIVTSLTQWDTVKNTCVRKHFFMIYFQRISVLATNRSMFYLFN